MRHVTLQTKTTTAFDVVDEQAWDAVASALIDAVPHGGIVTLSGPLGAGKTTCVQAIARRLGIPSFLPSPTFALMRTYGVPGNQGIRKVVHVDAYRIEHERELLALDLDDVLLDPGTLLVIEWPEKIPTWLMRREHAKVTIAE